MPSDRATGLAAAGPYVALYVLVAALVVAFVLQFLGLPTAVVVGVVLGALVLYSATVLYQGLFMIRYPGTAVEERMRPPVGRPWSYSVSVSELFTPDSNLGAIVVGLMGVLTGVVGLVIAVVMGSAVG